MDSTPSKSPACAKEGFPARPESERSRPIASKPRTTFTSHELTRLPRLTFGRRFLRHLGGILAWLAVRILTRTQVTGLENFPRRGPALMVSNHLGDADPIVAMAFLPPVIEGLAKIDLYFEYPWLGWLMDAYGVIWVHRGQPDRGAMRTALQAFAEGRIVGIAPEGRESLTGCLEEGTRGAAYLALRGNVTLVPVTFTGTSNAIIFGSLIKLRRPQVTLTVGCPFRLDQISGGRDGLAEATRLIMENLALQLPAGYRGVYGNLEEGLPENSFQIKDTNRPISR